MYEYAAHLCTCCIICLHNHITVIAMGYYYVKSVRHFLVSIETKENQRIYLFAENVCHEAKRVLIPDIMIEIKHLLGTTNSLRDYVFAMISP